MKIAFIGSSGFVGTNIIHYLTNNIDTDFYFGFFRNKSESNANNFLIDITKPDLTYKSLSTINPDVIIHLAAAASVDRSETNPENTFNVNREGTRNIAQVAKKLGCKVIMTSTDYVFPGNSNEIYNEKSPTNAVNIEGKSKAEAENLLQANLGNESAIIRISVPYGWRKKETHKSFLDWVVSSLKANKKIDLLTDQYNTPTSLTELGVIFEKLLNKWVGGIFHTVAPDVLSRFEFGKIICEVFDFKYELLNPITTEELKQKVTGYQAQRPMYCHLIDSRLKKDLNFQPRSVKENLLELKNVKKF
jgi:dTDP-4-dehydrorhamnose reductase